MSGSVSGGADAGADPGAGSGAEPEISKVANYKAGRLNWVGGRLEVTREAVRFAPNGANRAVGLGRHGLDLPLTRIHDVRRRWRPVTSIVELHTDAGVERVRCWGSRAVVERLRELVARAR